MIQTDFSECEFIDNEMWYYTYYDFCDQSKAIKKLYQCLSKQGKKFYSWYVYANIHMNETFKNAIWDFLNFDDEIYRIHLFELKRIYKAK